jgi:hypothetical protein
MCRLRGSCTQKGYGEVGGFLLSTGIYTFVHKEYHNKLAILLYQHSIFQEIWDEERQFLLISVINRLKM